MSRKPRLTSRKHAPALGLAPDYGDPLNVPKRLEETQSSIQADTSDIAAVFAQLGLPFNLEESRKSQIFDQLFNTNSSEGLEKAYLAVVDHAPVIKVAKATVERATRRLEEAKLNLKWTEIRSEVAGYVQDRSANPGNRVDKGQTLLSLRPDYVWIEANYKETQLRDIRIGMPVDLEVDAYPLLSFRGE